MKPKNILLASLLLSSCLLGNFAAAQNLPVAKPEEVGMSSARLKNIKSALQAEVEFIGTPEEGAGVRWKKDFPK